MQVNCGLLADKYIEYDPVIVFVDLILLEKQAYQHLLYNSDFKAYWKLMIMLWLGEAFRAWSFCVSISTQKTNINIYDGDLFQGDCNFYILLLQTAVTLTVFIATVIIVTELRWLLSKKRPHKYNAKDLTRALIVGGCSKLLGLLAIVWEPVALDLHYIFVQGYTVLCLMTAYSGKCICLSKMIDNTLHCTLMTRKFSFNLFINLSISLPFIYLTHLKL